MSSPPSITLASTRGNLPPTRRERSSDFLSPRIVAREAAKVFAARGVEVRPAMLRRLVTRFIEQGHTSLADVESWVIAYADPTGETAVRNVMRGAR